MLICLRRNTKKNWKQEPRSIRLFLMRSQTRFLLKTGAEVRITVPGHTQRGGEPCAYDRVLSTRIGAGAAEAILDGEYGVMIGIVDGKIKRVPLAECAGKLKTVDPKDQTVLAAKQIGISFGD